MLVRTINGRPIFEKGGSDLRDEKVLVEIKERNEQTICWVIEKYSKLLWTVVDAVLRNVGTQQDIEECVADVFISLWQRPGQFDPQRGRLKSWLCIVARSRALDRYRELSRRNTVSIDDVMIIGRMGVQDYVIREETKKELADAIDELSQIEREILIRRYFYEQKPRDISIALDIPVKQIDNYLYRSKLKLRRAVAKNGGLV